jgi:hypothetical protein
MPGSHKSWSCWGAKAIIACGFLVVETVLLRRLYVLVLIEHGARRLHVETLRNEYSVD